MLLIWIYNIFSFMLFGIIYTFCKNHILFKFLEMKLNEACRISFKKESHCVKYLENEFYLH